MKDQTLNFLHTHKEKNSHNSHRDILNGHHRAEIIFSIGLHENHIHVVWELELIENGSRGGNLKGLLLMESGGNAENFNIVVRMHQIQIYDEDTTDLEAIL